MARHYRFFLRNPATLSSFQHAESFELDEKLEGEIVFQLVKVLRAKAGDKVTLIPQGQLAPYHEYVFEVAAAAKHSVALTKKSEVTNDNELGFPLELLLCLPNKPEKLEFIIQKAVEIGVSAVRLFESDFSQMKHQLREERLRKILIEAAEQSERAVVPELVSAGTLEKFLESADDSETTNIFVAMERLSQDASPEATDSRSVEGKNVNPFGGSDKSVGIGVLVGPEGGFSDQEKKLMAGRSLKTFSLGKRILRMETAAIVSLGLAALA